ncbi:hypothetical protein ACU8KH_01084 [Lachancea thermotolerans]
MAIGQTADVDLHFSQLDDAPFAKREVHCALAGAKDAGGSNILIHTWATRTLAKHFRPARSHSSGTA